MMISKAKRKFIKSLQIKKYRKQAQCFLVEGAKSVQELLQSDFEVPTLIGTEEFLGQIDSSRVNEVIVVSAQELIGLGDFQTNETALAVASMKPNRPFKVNADEFALVLDDIRDPGNFGTIIRTADWYGIKKIIASDETADFYNSKVITATMGSFVRVAVFYTDLTDYLQNYKGKIFGTFLDGVNVHRISFDKGGLVVIGNEAHGISKPIEKLITDRVTIPRYGQAESLNAAIATGIFLDNINRTI